MITVTISNGCLRDSVIKTCRDQGSYQANGFTFPVQSTSRPT